MRADNSLQDLRVYRFGQFRLDTSERTLRRDGQVVAVSPKAWEVLKILVERGGAVVDKQFLMDSVWPETFVEENNLAFNISVIRKLLGDEAGNPKFIETVPRRGYRFRAEVDVEEPAEPLKEPAKQPAAVVPAVRRRWFGLAALGLAALTVLLLLGVRWSKAPKLKQTDRILVADFVNESGDPVFDATQRDASLADATTSSLEAFSAYSLGWKMLGSKGAAAALPHFRRAIELDKNFAMAYAWLGRIYADLDESDAAMANTQQAWRLREHASDLEKFFIDTNYELFVTGNLQQARQTAELWSQTYPRVANPHFTLSGIPNKVLGNFENGITEARRGLSMEPDFAIGYYNLAVNYAYLEEFDKAEDALAKGNAQGLEIDEMVMLRYELAFLRGDESEMARQAQRAHARSGSETWMSLRQACVLGYRGHLHEARGILRRAMREAEFASQRERAGLWQANAAVREAFFGNFADARQRVAAALGMTKTREVQYGAALALALAGDNARAAQISDDLRNNYPHDTCVQFNYLPVLRARLALNRDKPEEAIEALQTAIPNEAGIPRSMISGLFGALYPAYMRGEAYLRARKGTEAANEFQKVLRHRGIVVADPVGPLAQLELGRAQRMAGDRIQARVAYQEFLALWKNADRDIPILRQAKAEYAAFN